MRKKIGYFWARCALQLTGIIFLSQTVVEVAGIATRKPGFEWVYPACATAFAMSCVWTLVIILLNSKEK